MSLQVGRRLRLGEHWSNQIRFSSVEVKFINYKEPRLIKTIAVASFAILLFGCASPIGLKVEEYRNTVNEMKPKAEAGTLKWSVYYQMAIDKLKEMPPTVHGRDREIQEYYYGIEMAKKYESGEISKEEFYKWRAGSNGRTAEAVDKFNRVKAECEFEAVSRANPNPSNDYAGNNINRRLSSAITGGYEVAMRQSQIFELCMKAKGVSNN